MPNNNLVDDYYSQIWSSSDKKGDKKNVKKPIIIKKKIKVKKVEPALEEKKAGVNSEKKIVKKRIIKPKTIIQRLEVEKKPAKTINKRPEIVLNYY